MRKDVCTTVRVGSVFAAILLAFLGLLMIVTSQLAWAGQWSLTIENEGDQSTPQQKREESGDLRLIQNPAKAAELKRYLARYNKARSEMETDHKTGKALLQKLIADLDSLTTQRGDLARKAHELGSESKKRREEYERLKQANQQLKHTDPAQDPRVKDLSQQAMEKAAKACELAEKYAKSKDKKQKEKIKRRIRTLVADINTLKDTLHKYLDHIIDLLRPVYRALQAAKAKVTEDKRKAFADRYVTILEIILAAGETKEQLVELAENIDSNDTKAKKAKDRIKTILRNNPNLSGVGDHQKIINRLNEKLPPSSDITSISPDKKSIFEFLIQSYESLKKKPGISVVKNSLKIKQLMIIYSEAKDESSQSYKEALDWVAKAGVAIREIQGTKRACDQIWSRVRLAVKDQFNCVKKWINRKKAKAYEGRVKLIRKVHAVGVGQNTCRKNKLSFTDDSVLTKVVLEDGGSARLILVNPKKCPTYSKQGISLTRCPKVDPSIIRGWKGVSAGAASYKWGRGGEQLLGTIKGDSMHFTGALEIKMNNMCGKVTKLLEVHGVLKAVE
jgi:hypothetical protein